ncbi:MAG: hypothetical protein PHT95_05055 [Candidatus Omnitrophica bacterium]|nr:hypothetical protein [Candidatus Omnitrophota bacterium]MDD4013225.1 hypothetical protein [Candidatus Omnitrophota bacterium]
MFKRSGWARAKAFVLVPTVCVSFLFQGCATTSNAGRHSSDLTIKGLSDEDALKKVVALYNVKVETADDMIARNIALGVYLDELRKRKSEYIASSGVFDLEFRREDLKKWTDREIVRMFRSLDTMSMPYDRAETSAMSENEKALMVLRLTARQVVHEEGKRRDIVRNVSEAAMNALMVAASIAVAII